MRGTCHFLDGLEYIPHQNAHESFIKTTEKELDWGKITFEECAKANKKGLSLHVDFDDLLDKEPTDGDQTGRHSYTNHARRRAEERHHHVWLENSHGHT